MNNKSKYLLKNVGILTISNFASKILVFLLVPLYTSVLSTTEYGIYDLVVSMVQLLFPLLTLNVTDAIMRFAMDKEKSIDEVAAIGLKYLTRSFFPIGIFLLICHLGGYIESILGFEFLIFLYYLFYVSNQFLIQLSKGLERVADMAGAGVISTAVLLGGNILFLLVFNWGLIGFFWANILSQAIPVLFFSIRLEIWKYFCTGKKNLSLQKEMFVYCLPLIFSTIGWWVNNTSDKYVVAFMCGAASNGLLSVAYKIPSILNTIQSIFIQAWQISAIKEYDGDKTREFYGNTFAYLNLFICFVATSLIILLRPIAKIMYSKEFFEAWKYVPFLIVASVLNSSSGFLGPILSAAKDSKSMAKSAIYGAVSNVILNIILVSLVGMQGATIATLIASYIIYVVRKLAVGNRIKIENYWKTYIIWFLLIAQAIIEVISLSYMYQLFIIVLMILINRSELVSLIKKVYLIIKRRVK